MNINAPTQFEVNKECRKYIELLDIYANSDFNDFNKIYFMFMVQRERLSGTFRAASLVLNGEDKANYLLEVASFYESVESVCVEHLFKLVTAVGKPTKAMSSFFKELHKEVKGKACGIRNASTNISKEGADAILAKLFGENEELTGENKELTTKLGKSKEEHDVLKDEYKKLISKHNRILENIQQNLALTNEEFVLLCKKKHAVLGTKQANQARRMYTEEGLTPEQIAGIMEVSLKTIIDALEYRTY